MITVKEEFHFHYAHRNQYLSGSKCEQLHGHTARVSVYVEAPEDEASGVTLEFSILANACKKIKDLFDHKTLIDMSDKELMELVDISPVFAKSSVILSHATSAENMAKTIFDNIQSDIINHARVTCVEFKETNSSTVILKR